MSVLLERTNIPAAFFARAEADEKSVLYTQPEAREGESAEAPRPRHHSTYGEVSARVKKIAAYLTQRGLKRGEKVAIISNTRPEWMECDLGVLSAGGVVVSVYPSLTYQEIGYILFDSGARFVILENEEQLKKIRAIETEEIPIPASEDRAESKERVSIEHVILFEDVPSPGNSVTLRSLIQETGTVEESQMSEWRKLTTEDLATLVYTSGTTGPPKGVMQTHGNHLANVRQAYESGIYRDSSVIALFLPLAHSFAKLMGYVGLLTTVRLEYPAIVDRKTSKINQLSVARDLREGRAEVIPVVPRLLEKMQEALYKRAKKNSAQGIFLRICIWAATSRYASLKSGKAPSIVVALAYLVTASLRRKVTKLLFGSRFAYAVSGGAKLQPLVNEFFDALGIEILEGYGLTETCVATNVNRYGKKKVGSVGPVLTSDIEIKITADGEICYRGPNIAKGYLNRPTATKAAWDSEGWFHTGDLGSLDQDGFLFIQGRKKELIVTAGGKKIPPEAIENRIKELPLVSQALLFGDEKPYCVALVSPDHHAVHSWAQAGHFPDTAAVGPESDLFKAIWEHVKAVNKSLASYESIKRIAIIPEEWTVENGLLTPTMKIKRKEIVKRYRNKIEALYKSGEGGDG